MALCGVLLVAVVASLRPAAAFYVALGPLLVGSLILSRFDLWPALLATASLVLLVRGRHLSGWALLGAAVAAKLWPLVLVPLALAWSIRRGRPLAPFAGAAVLLAVTLPFARRLARWALGQHQRPGLPSAAGGEPGRGVPDDVLAPRDRHARTARRTSSAITRSRRRSASCSCSC